MPRTPSYRLHKASGLAVVELAGRPVYLGKHGTPESKAEYDRVVAEWLAGGRQLRPREGVRLTVAGLVDRYWGWAQTWYVKGGQPTAQQERVRRSLDYLLAFHSGIPAADFSPLKLKAVRERMVSAGWTRTHVNHCVGCVKRCFKWGVAEELVPSATFEALRAVEGLRAGRCAAREGKPVRPAPEEAVRAAQAHAPGQVAALIELQLWTGMRPGEAVLLRPCDVDRAGRVDLGMGPVELPGLWVYRPAAHKTQHHGHERVVLLGPRAQAALAPFLLRAPGAYCFSPAEAEAERLAGLRARRRTPVQPSQRARRKRRPKRTPGERYTAHSYAHAVARAIRRAGCAHWHPHQLRHNAATRLVSEFGWEHARILLGQRDVAVTRIYAEDDLRKAADAARKSG